MLEIKKIQTNNKIQIIDETKRLVLREISNIDNPLSKLTKHWRNNIQNNKIKMKGRNKIRYQGNLENQ